MSQNTALPTTSIVIAGADAHGGELRLGKNFIFSMHAVWPAGLTGGLGVEVSNTIDGPYEAVTGSEQAISGSAGSFLWNYTSAGFAFARPYFDWTSGSGTIPVTSDAKGAPR